MQETWQLLRAIFRGFFNFIAILEIPFITLHQSIKVMKKYAIIPALLCLTLAVTAKHKHKKGSDAPAAPPKADSASKKGPKPYNKVITDKAVTKHGLFTVHKVDDKWYFEIPDSLLGREMIVTTRYSKIRAKW